MMKLTQIVAVTGLLSIMLVLNIGCHGSSANDIDSFLKPYQRSVTESRYIMMPPDVIEVHCKYVPEINLQVQQIRPDGKVSFEGIGTFQAAGKTPEELAGDIKTKISGLYKIAGDYPVDIRVSHFRSNVYYVIGEVLASGPKEFNGRVTAVTAISSAGLRPTAWKGHIKVIRPTEMVDGQAKSFELNWKDIEMGDLSRNVLLQEGDIIYVPPTILAAIGNVFAEFAYPITQVAAPAITVQRATTGGTVR